MSEVKTYTLSPEELAHYRALPILPYKKPCVTLQSISELTELMMGPNREVKHSPQPRQRDIPLKPCLRCGEPIPRGKSTTPYSYAHRKYCGMKCAGEATGSNKKGKKKKSTVWEQKIMKGG